MLKKIKVEELVLGMYFAGFDDAAEALDSFDTDSDSALYDAVVFQGGVMPFDLDNG